MRLSSAIAVFSLLTILLSGCGGGPRPRRAAAPPDDARAYRQCMAEVGKLDVQVQPLPDRTFANGCSATHAIKLVAIGIPITNLGAMKCMTALPFMQWVRQTVSQQAETTLGKPVVKIESFGTFACRPKNNVKGADLSEHGKANAVDIAAFVLQGGRRITVLKDWNGPDPQARAFLRAVHQAACKRFNIVLGPDANAYHRDHMHFDMGMGRYCR
ncbi:extensin family protein [Sphingomonas sp. BIUV-7]|uniref:Extensin family protein n=1 Tax=Sphingomonas natans TaxID=3063330 RepID=A0ABT8Y5U8_9SPHN|nr:extensin family protein [Sphingomonas sp. BIUV-7]MDO6413040.1 extensin family protein [Sphingomonas sp. BIUV-7]